MIKKFLFAFIICLGAVSCVTPNTGDACENRTQCSGDVCLKNTEDVDFKGGYCTNECRAYWDCERDETCLGLNDVYTCWLMCVDNSDCREGYTCQPIGFFGPYICFPE